MIAYYGTISGKTIEDRIYFFLDEIQKLKDWQNQIKIYYDHYPNLKFIVSGSSSLFIKRSTESLAGRTVELYLPPLSFAEYLYFNDKNHYIENIKMWGDKLSREFEVYSQRQFIELINQNKSFIEQYTQSLIKKIIYEDIPMIYSIDYPHILFELYQIIRKNPGMLLNHNSISSDLEITSITVRKYIHYLEQAYLIKKLYNYSKNQLTSEKKLKKIYPISSSFSDTDMSKVVECLLATQIDSNFFWRKYHEVDLVVICDGASIPVEVKYKNKIKSKDIAGLRSFMKKFKSPYAIVLTKNYENTDENIRYIPAWKYMLDLKLF